MLDRERGDLDVWDVVAAESRRLGELGRNRGVSRARRDDPHGGLVQIGRRNLPALVDRHRVLAEDSRARD